MSAQQLATAGSQALFLVLCLHTAVAALRHPGRASRDTAAFFATAAALIVESDVARVAGMVNNRVVAAVAWALMLLMPYLLIRLVDDHAGVSRRVMRVIQAALLAGIALCAVTAPVVPGWLAVAEMVYFASVLALTTVSFLRVSRASMGVTRRRMRAVAAACAILGADVCVAVLTTFLSNRVAGFAMALTHLLGLAAALLFAAGFATPRALRQIWQQPELRDFGHVIAERSRESGPFEATLLEFGVAAARALGAKGAGVGLYQSGDDTLLFPSTAGGSYRLPVDRSASGATFLAQTPRLVRSSDAGSPDQVEIYRAWSVEWLLMTPITIGDRRLGVLAVYSTRAPVFVEEDLELVCALAETIGLAILATESARELKRSQELLRQVIDNTPVMLVALDAAGTVTLFEGRGIDRRRPATSRFLGHSVFDLFAHNEVVVEHVRRALAGERGSVLLNEEGRQFEAAYAPVHDESGRVDGATATITDITDRLEVERAHAESMAKSRFLSVMSHEFRTPLNSILGFTRLLADEAEAGGWSARHRRYISNVETSGRHLLELVNDLLDIAKIDAERMRLLLDPVDCSLALENIELTLVQMAREAGLRLEVERPAQPSVVMADRRRLNQALLNLVSNAVKFTPPGGTVRVWVEEAGAVQRFIVTDSGVGIEADQLEGIFDEFAQAEAGLNSGEGSGLGLPLARRLARLMGGDVTVSSTRGRGSTFVLELPSAGMLRSIGA